MPCLESLLYRLMKYLNLLCLLLGSISLCSQDNSTIASTVEIRRTSYGVPHILAPDLKGVAFGLAWCELEDYGDRVLYPLVSARGELAQMIGYDAIESDFINQLGYQRAVQTYHRLDQDTRDLMEGFAAGVNHFLEKRGATLPEFKDWSFSAYDVLALTTRVYTGNQQRGYKDLLLAQKARRDSLRHVIGEGSNSWAFAPSRTESGHAILVRNPHLSWTAGYYEAQLTVPGKLNFYGDFRIGGVFAIIGGFNPHLGWSTTNNNPDLDEFYALTIDTNRVDHYLLDGVSFALESKIVEVFFKNGAGTAKERREFLFTPFGPVVHRDEGKIYIVKTAGDQEFRRGQQYTRMLLAQNLEEWKAAMRMQAITSSNYMYADAAGNIFYVWNAAIPDLPRPSGGDSLAIEVTSSRHIWNSYVPFDSLPQLLNPKGGYLHNENDPFHFTNLHEILSPENYPDYFPEPRLRQRSQHSLQLIHNEDILSLEEVVNRKHSMGMLLADQIKTDLLKILEDNKPNKEMRQVIQHLKEWDNKVTRTSRGGVLFENWWTHYNQILKGISPYKIAWQFDQAMETPRGINDPNAAIQAMQTSIQALKLKYGTWDLAWGEIHRLRHGDLDLPVGGGPGGLGCFRVLYFTDTPDEKRAIRGGDGWQLAVEFSDPPKAYSILAYGQSNDPDSPHHTDQAALFANNEMKRIAFTEAEIKQQLIRTYHPK